jgi:hypothetical protein
LKEKDNDLRRHAPRIKPGLHKAVHVGGNALTTLFGTFNMYF